jgi:hypothetical protein
MILKKKTGEILFKWRKGSDYNPTKPAPTRREEQYFVNQQHYTQHDSG